MKKDKIILIVLFCVLLFCGSVIPCFLPQKKISQMENRTLQTKPAFNVTSFLSGMYQTKYETAQLQWDLCGKGWVFAGGISGVGI